MFSPGKYHVGGTNNIRTTSIKEKKDINKQKI